MEYTARGWRQLYNDRASAAPPMARDTSAFVKVLARSIRERTARAVGRLRCNGWLAALSLPVTGM